MAGNDQREDRGGGGGKGNETATPCFSASARATGSNSSNTTGISISGVDASNGLAFVPITSVRNPCSLKAACTVCKKEFECGRMRRNIAIRCPHCGGILLAAEKTSPPIINNSINNSSSLWQQNSVHHAANNVPFDCSTPQILEQQRFADLISTRLQGYPERMTDNSISASPFVNLFREYELAVADPSYFYRILITSNDPNEKTLQIPEFQGALLDLHRIFVEVTSRGGICKVCKNGRLREVCAALPQEIGDQNLYYLYWLLLYTCEIRLCNFPYELHLPPLSSFVGSHPMPRLIGGQSSRQIQPSLPNPNSPLVNNSQLWTGSQAGFNFKSHLADHPSSSSARARPMPGMVEGQSSQKVQLQPPFPDLSTALVNNQTIFGPNFEQQPQPSIWMNPFQRVSASSLPLPDTRAVAPPLDTPSHQSPAQYHTDNRQNINSAGQVQSLRPQIEAQVVSVRQREVPALHSTSIHGSTPGFDEFTFREHEAISQIQFGTLLNAAQLGNLLEVEQATTDTKDNSGFIDSED